MKSGARLRQPIAHIPGRRPIIPSSLRCLPELQLRPAKLGWSGTCQPLPLSFPSLPPSLPPPLCSDWRQETAKSKAACDVVWCCSVCVCVGGAVGDDYLSTSEQYKIYIYTQTIPVYSARGGLKAAYLHLFL